MLTDTLDADISFLIHAVSNSPLDNSKVNIVLLASVEALVEALGVEEMAAKVDCEALHVRAL